MLYFGRARLPEHAETCQCWLLPSTYTAHAMFSHIENRGFQKDVPVVDLVKQTFLHEIHINVTKKKSPATLAIRVCRQSQIEIGM